MGAHNFREVVSSEAHKGTRAFFLANNYPEHCYLDIVDSVEGPGECVVCDSKHCTPPDVQEDCRTMLAGAVAKRVLAMCAFCDLPLCCQMFGRALALPFFQHLFSLACRTSFTLASSAKTLAQRTTTGSQRQRCRHCSTTLGAWCPPPHVCKDFVRSRC